MFSQPQWSQFFSELEERCTHILSTQSTLAHSKPDHSPVTEADLALSAFLRDHALAKGFHFHSEEEHGELRFPALILDPLDGTREYVVGRPECAFSAAWMCGPGLDAPHAAAIYNPFTGFRLASGMAPRWVPRPPTQPWRGLVSRSEWEQGLYRGRETGEEWTVQPRGSIAFKLALLASGACDFVVSLRPKNVWDIAAGTLLAAERGMECWSAGERVLSLDRGSYQAPLIWGPPSLSAFLRRAFPA